MKANKIVTVQDLTLNKPTAEIKGVAYNWATNKANIQILFKEEGSINGHERSLEMDTNGEEVTAAQVNAFIKNELKDFE